ncbi:MAG: hypothetical protein QOH37_1763 [Nocardioidaceae bacterium]|nr:hypothetical protein [Nocardioidaceae bacterium]
MLGHSSSTMTLDTYGHLFDDRLDEVSSALNKARQSVELPERRLTQRNVRTGATRVPRPPATNAPVAQTLPNGGVGDRSVHRSERRTAGQNGNASGAPGRIRTFAPASGEGSGDEADDDEK